MNIILTFSKSRGSKEDTVFYVVIAYSHVLLSLI